MTALFDLIGYQVPETPITEEDPTADYEDPDYIKPELHGRDGGKTKALRELLKTAPNYRMYPIALAHKIKVRLPRIEGLSATDGHLFELGEGKDEWWEIRLTEKGIKVAELVAAHLPPDAELLNESIGFKYINLTWFSGGKEHQKTFQLMGKPEIVEAIAPAIEEKIPTEKADPSPPPMAETQSKGYIEEKTIKKNGKVVGVYRYRRYREDGKLKSIYLGKKEGT